MSKRSEFSDPGDVYNRAVHLARRGDLPKGAPEFSEATYELLRKRGWFVYNLTGTTPANWRSNGHAIELGNAWTYPDDPYSSQIMGVRSARSQVAVLPGHFFLPHSADKPLRIQLAQMQRQAGELAGKFPGTRLVIGSVADYIELGIKHLKETKRNIFVVERDLHESFDTRTSTVMHDGEIVNVQMVSHADNDIHLTIHPNDFRNPYVQLAPLLVPVSGE